MATGESRSLIGREFLSLVLALGAVVETLVVRQLKMYGDECILHVCSSVCTVCCGCHFQAFTKLLAQKKQDYVCPRVHKLLSMVQRSPCTGDARAIPCSFCTRTLSKSLETPASVKRTPSVIHSA